MAWRSKAGELRVVIHCDDCLQRNRKYMGVPDYELVNVVYTSFTDAVQHVVETGHEMSLYIDENG